MSEKKLLRVVGLASAVPFNAKDPTAPVNRRISLIIMNKEAEERALKAITSIEETDSAQAEKAAKK